MKRKKAIDFLTVTLFAGVLLTFMIYIGMDTIFAFDDDDEKSFNQMFHGNATITEFSRYFDYKIFGHIDGGDYIIGEDDWLFEAVDSQNGYERLLDYIGGSQLTYDELEAFSETLIQRSLMYEKEGVQYVMIVIPDAMNVCSDKVPGYLGEYSADSRLSQITEHMASIAFEGFINPADSMKNDTEEIAMYNNTENSINAYGAYCIYDSVMDMMNIENMSGVDRMERDDFDFYTRLTDGRTIAKNAGIEMIVKNRTVSLSDNAPENYRVISSTVSTTLTNKANMDEGTRIVVECTNSWDRIQLMPYFSNTFDTVIYHDSLSSDVQSILDLDVGLVIQIIRESELDRIIK